jgi:hypothetical protein
MVFRKSSLHHCDVRIIFLYFHSDKQSQTQQAEYRQVAVCVAKRYQNHVFEAPYVKADVLDVDFGFH